MMIEFFLPMIPPTVTHQEHKVVVDKKSGRMRFYDPPELAAARAKLMGAVGRNRPEQKLVGPLQLVTKWIWPISAPDGQLSLEGVPRWRWKTTKPDTDNLIKMLKDCMTRTGFWEDDALVVSEVTEKFLGERPGIWIQVRELE